MFLENVQRSSDFFRCLDDRDMKITHIKLRRSWQADKSHLETRVPARYIHL